MPYPFASVAALEIETNELKKAKENFTISIENITNNGANISLAWENTQVLIPLEVPTDDIQGTKVWRPKDQAKLKNRLIMFVESHFPGPFYALKRFAIRILVR